MNRLFIVFLLSILTGCTGGNSVTTSDLVPAARFQQGKPHDMTLQLMRDEVGQLRITLNSQYLEPGASLQNVRRENPLVIDAEASWKGGFYVLSSKHETAIRLTVNDIDRANSRMVVEVSATLVEPVTGEFIEFEQGQVVVSYGE